MKISTILAFFARIGRPKGAENQIFSTEISAGCAPDPTTDVGLRTSGGNFGENIDFVQGPAACRAIRFPSTRRRWGSFKQ
jgi:hypothetical protein